MDVDFWNETWRSDTDQVMVPDRVLQLETEDLRPGHALDLGCGNGANALALAAAGWQVTGIDCSAHAIALARQAARARGLAARFICREFDGWRPDPCFDLVISTYALPAGVAGQAVLRVAAQALRPGGILLVAEWDRSMSSEWGVSPEEFVTVAELSSAVPELDIEKAEVRDIPDMFADPADPRARYAPGARVAFLRARKPDGAGNTPAR